MPVRRWGEETVVFEGTAEIDPGFLTPINPAVAALADGGFAIVWQATDPTSLDIQVLYQRFNAFGSAVGGPIDVAVAAGFNTAGSHRAPTIDTRSDGRVVVSWIGPSNSGDALLAILEPNGTLVSGTNVGGIFGPNEQFASDVFTIGADGSGTTSVLLYNEPIGGFADVQVQLFDSVNGALANATLGGTGAQLAPAGSALDDGRFVVVYQDDGVGIRGQIFGADATPQTTLAFDNAPLVASATAIDPDVAGLANGTFVVAWADGQAIVPDVDARSIRAQRYDASGDPIGADFVVNTTTAGEQGKPAIQALATGGFLITWESEPIVALNREIRGQLFDAFGAKQGVEFFINTTTANSQQRPAITALADGRIVVVWEDQQSTTAQNVVFQILDPRDGIVTGGTAADTLLGHNSLADEISGFDGNDLLDGLGGADALYGGAGNDTLRGGSGDDDLFGGRGRNRLEGGSGDDTLAGDRDRDTLVGGAGADVMNGLGGIDLADYLTSSGVRLALDGSFAATGDAAGDTLIGIESVRGSQVDADRLRGATGNDSLLGEGGNDTLEGGIGNDTLIGGLGNDAMNGGFGSDLFNYSSLAEGGDSIFQFSSAADTIRVRAVGFGGGLIVGTLTADRLVANANPQSNLAGTGQFLYDTDTGALSYDANGSTLGGAGPVLVATLIGAPSLVASAILVF
jgi:Ca2+-binding RTX toxin-like protein